MISRNRRTRQGRKETPVAVHHGVAGEVQEDAEEVEEGSEAVGVAEVSE
jgi:hypothetical protein